MVDSGLALWGLCMGSAEKQSAEDGDADIGKTCFGHRMVISATGKMVEFTEENGGRAVDLAMSGIDSALSAPGTVRDVAEDLARKLVGAEAELPEAAVTETTRPD
jgi:hypothetical protein